MSTIQPIKLLERKRHLAGLLEMACQELELPPTKWDQAKTAYGSVAKHLADCPVLGRFEPRIFPQGSAALLTTVKPLDREEFDIDLVCHLQRGDDSLPQAWVKKVVGDRLRAHGTYGKMLSEYKRAWRLDYAKEAQMHLDITPAVNHSTSRFRDLAVTDKATRQWHETNPAGYAAEFSKVAALLPQFAAALQELRARAAAADVEPLPDQRPVKGYLRRTVQLVKRHRSLYFERDAERAPISVILTTLAAKSYARVVRSGRIYDNEFDVVADTVRSMSAFVEHRWNSEWWVPNDTTEDENFADKWNHDPKLPAAFDEWHRAAVADFDALASAADSEAGHRIFERIVGQRLGASIRAKVVSTVSAARKQQTLGITSGGLLAVGGGLPVPANTFFGA